MLEIPTWIQFRTRFWAPFLDVYAQNMVQKQHLCYSLGTTGLLLATHGSPVGASLASSTLLLRYYYATTTNTLTLLHYY